MKKPSIAAFGLIAAIIAVGSLFIMREPVVLDEQAAERLGKNIGSTGQPVDAKTALAQGRKIVDTIADLRRANTSQKPIIGLKRGYGHEVPNPQQQQAIDQILASLPESTVLHMDNFQGTLRHLRGDLSSLSNHSMAYKAAKMNNCPEKMATALLSELSGITGIQSPEESFGITKVSHDKIGFTHVSLAQEIDGIPVWGADIKVHFNADNDPIEVSGIYSPAPKYDFWPDQPLPEEEAIANALAELGQQTAPFDTTVEKIAYWNPNTKPHPCYQVALSPALDQSYFVFVSAIDGKVIRVYDRIISGSSATGNALDLQGSLQEVKSYFDEGEYYALDITLPMFNPASNLSFDETIFGGLLVYREDNGVWDVISSLTASSWSPEVVSAQNNMRIAYTYFNDTHGRSSYDDNGSTIRTIVNYGEQYGNAFWNAHDKIFAYGDGNAIFSSLAGSLDTCVHEYTHAVVTYTAGLKYESQSGALDEHFADLFAAMVDRDDWMIGEDIVLNGIAMRDMQNPANPLMTSNFWQPATMFEYLNLPLSEDHGGVHQNNGILNRMAYVLSEEAPAIGKDKLEVLAYRALNNYLVQYSQFIDYRRAMISAAQDLYGFGSLEEDAVKAAFNTVAIYDGEALPDPVVYSAFGTEEVLFLYADEAAYDPATDSPYLLGANIGGQNYLMSNRYAKKTRPCIGGDAEDLVFVDLNGDLCYIDKTGEHVLDYGAEVQSISLSKDGAYMAIVYQNTPSIFLYDSANDTFDTIELTIANPDGEDSVLGNPDIVTFSPSGDRLVFDATSKVLFSDGNEYDAWGVYSMRIADGRVSSVWQPSQGAMFGNPHFSNLHPNLILADMVDLNTLESRAVCIDLWNQKRFALTDLDEDYANPSFSGKDESLLYVEKGWLYHNLYSADFQGSEFAVVSSSKTELYEQSDPIAYPVGYTDNPAYMAPKAKIITLKDLDFSLTKVGETREIDLVIANSGTAMLELYDMHLVGSDTDQFSFLPPVSMVSPGNTVDVTLRFTPKTIGDKNASLKIYSTAPEQKETTVLLSGEGYSLDSDNDGMLDAWEIEYLGSIDFDADDDNDADGLSNYGEYIAGTAPHDKDSCLKIDSLEVLSETLRVMWHGGTGVTQRLLASPDLQGTWNPIYTNYPPTPITNSYFTPLGTSNIFFRIEAGSL